MSNIFRYENVATDYTLERPNPLHIYFRHAVNFIKKQRSESSQEEVETWVRSYMKENMNDQDMKIIYHEPGTAKKERVKMTHVMTHLGDDVVTPSGAIYLAQHKEESKLSSVLINKKKERSVFKKKQFQAELDNDSEAQDSANRAQTSIKLFSNGIPGQFGYPGSPIYDKPTYNAITSGGRICVKTGYAHTERLLSGSLYFPNLTTVITYIQNIITYKTFDPDLVERTLTEYNLYRPTVDDIYTFLLRSLSLYTHPTDKIKETLKSYLEKYTSQEIAYLYYFCSLYNLAKHNTTFVKDMIADIFADVPKDDTLLPEDVKKVDGELSNMLLPPKFDMVDRNSDLNKGITLHPEKIKLFTSQCNAAEHKITGPYKQLLTTFFFGYPGFPRLWEHTDIIRSSVGVSDTDSVIFTTKEVLEFMFPHDIQSEEAKKSHFFIVYVTSKTLEHNLAHIATQMGVSPERRGDIQMKNEFYYPLFIRTSLAKHYIGKIVIQEGIVLSEPKMDLKGVSLRGSGIPKPAQEYFSKHVIDWFYEEMEKHSSISALELLIRVAKYETEVYRSIRRKERTYLPLLSAKEKGDYKDADKTIHYNCEFWNECFGETKGYIELPGKVWSVPLKDPGIFLNEEWRAKLTSLDDKKILRNIDKFFETHHKASMTRFVFPMDMVGVPDIIADEVDYRQNIYANCSPIYLFMSSLGVFYTENTDIKLIATDMLTDETLKKHDIDRIA